MNELNRKPTRMAILAMLKKNKQMTAAQVGALLGITPMGARQHLTAMEQQGLLQSEFVKQKQGRPALYFSLSAQSDEFFPQQYHTLVMDILREMESQQGRSKINQLIQSRRDTLCEAYKQYISQAGNLPEQLQTLTELRERDGYMAEMKEGDDEYLLIEHNCPISNAAHEFPEFCHHELQMFRELLGVPVERTQHMMEGAQSCVYKILLKAKQEEESSKDPQPEPTGNQDS